MDATPLIILAVIALVFRRELAAWARDVWKDATKEAG